MRTQTFILRIFTTEDSFQLCPDSTQNCAKKCKSNSVLICYAVAGKDGRSFFPLSFKKYLFGWHWILVATHRSAFLVGVIDSFNSSIRDRTWIGSAESLSHCTSREVPDGEVFNVVKWIWTLSDLIWIEQPLTSQSVNMLNSPRMSTSVNSNSSLKKVIAVGTPGL